MNFMIFSAQYLPTVGGVERYTNALAKKLIEKKHNVTVVTSALVGLPMQETDADGINIVRLPVIPVMNGRFPVLKPSAEKRSFEKFFKENKPDFCVIQTRFYTNSIMAAILCKKYSVPNIVIEHGTAHLIQGGVTGFLGNIYEHLVFKYINSKCPDIYGVSMACCNWLEHFGIRNKNIMYNAIDMDFINGIDAAEKNEFGIDADKTVVCFSARLITEKGIYKAIDAFKKYDNQDDVALVILGDGAEFENVKKYACDNIKVLGSVRYEKALSIYKMADIFILPTDYPEGFPTAVIEAAACYNCIITTDRGGSREMIIDDKHGIIVEPNTVDNIAAAISKAVSNSDFRKVCADNAYKLVGERFTWEQTSEKLISIAREKTKGNV